MEVLIISNSLGELDEAPRKRMLDLDWELLDNRYHHIIGEEEMMNEVPSVDAIILGSDIVSKWALDKADKLKTMSRYDVGIDNINTAEAEERSIAITVTKSCDTEAVADYTIVLMLATLRHARNVHSSLQKGIWKKETGMDLCHKTIGVSGLGAIGRQVIKRLKGFESEMLGYDIFADEERREEGGICLLSSQETFKQVGITTLHVPVNVDGTHFTTQQELELMKPEAILVNTARAFLIDETVMVQTLRQKHIYGYGMGVSSREPHTNPKFIGSNNVVYSPHTVTVSVEVVNTMSHTAVEHLMEYFGVTKWQEKLYMKHIVWARIDNRLIHGQAMTQWIQYTKTDEVLIIDDSVAKDSLLQIVIKPNIPSKISLKVSSVEDAIGYLDEDGKHEEITILVETPVVLDELSDVGVRLKSINVGGVGAKAGRKPVFENISASEEKKEAFRNLLNKGINVFLRVIVTEPEEGIAKYLQKGNGIPICIRSNQAVYRR